MKQILLGTEGNQPFKITQQGVSRQHARITIGDDGIWTLEDLNSTNGTFIRNEEGEAQDVAPHPKQRLFIGCAEPVRAGDLLRKIKAE